MVPADKCGVQFVKVFHLYRGFFRKKSKNGDFVKSSVRKTIPDNWLKKKTKIKGIVIRTRFRSLRLDGSSFSFNENSVVLLKKRLTTKGKELLGPITRSISRKKFINSFAGAV